MMDKKRKSTYQFAIIGFVLMNLLLSNFTPIVMCLEEDYSQATLDSSEESTTDSSESLDESMQSSEEEEIRVEDSTESVEEGPPTSSTTETSGLNGTQEEQKNNTDNTKTYTHIKDVQKEKAVSAKGQVGTVNWELYDDGKLKMTSGGKWESSNFDVEKSPWASWNEKITSIEISSEITVGSSLAGAFRNLYKCKSITGLDKLILSSVNPTNMDSTFYGLSALEELDLTGLNTSKVTDMSAMLLGTSSLKELNITGLDTSNVTTMSAMFYGTGLSSDNLDINELDTGNVTNMSSMFKDARNLTNIDLRNLNLKKVTNMSSMFQDQYTDQNNDGTIDESQLCTVKFGKLSNENIDMNSMFRHATHLEQVEFYEADEKVKVLKMAHMFMNTKSLTNIDLSTFDTSQVTDMSSVFNRASSLTSVDLSGFDTSKVTNMSSMFSGASSLASVDLSNFDTNKVTNTSSMFSGASSLTSIDLSNFDMNHVTDLSHMFFQTSKLGKIILGQNFSFNNNMDGKLPPAFNGKNEDLWQAIGDGDEDTPNGKVYSNGELMTNYDGNNMAGTYVASGYDPSMMISVDVPEKVSFGAITSEKIVSNKFNIANNSRLPLRVVVTEYVDTDFSFSLFQSLKLKIDEYSEGNDVSLIDKGNGDISAETTLFNLCSEQNINVIDSEKNEELIQNGWRNNWNFQFDGAIYEDQFNENDLRTVNHELKLKFIPLTADGNNIWGS